MTIVKVTELEGVALDYAVAVALGGTDLWYDTVATWWIKIDGKDRALSNAWSDSQSFAPSSDWRYGGPILDREPIEIRRRTPEEEATLAHPNPNFRVKAELWVAGHYYCAFGSTPLIAAMRCYVASKAGLQIDIPQELLK